MEAGKTQNKKTAYEKKTEKHSREGDLLRKMRSPNLRRADLREVQ